jgi:hypothetical protein
MPLLPLCRCFCSASSTVLHLLCCPVASRASSLQLSPPIPAPPKRSATTDLLPQLPLPSCLCSTRLPLLFCCLCCFAASALMPLL